MAWITFRCKNCGNDVEVQSSKNNINEIICPLCKNIANKIQFSFTSLSDNKGFVKTHKSKFR